MSASLLDRLLAEDLQASACPFSTGPGLRRFFGQRPEIRALREGLQRGAITEESFRDFVTSLLAGMKQGVLFGHDGSLAALAVACEGWQAPFADTFLRELAELRLAEMPLGPRVAREVLAERASPGGGQQSPKERLAGPVEGSLPPEPAQPSS